MASKRDIDIMCLTDNIEGIIASFKEYPLSEINYAISSLVEIGAPTVEALINSLNDPDVYIRIYSCETLGLISDNCAIIPLNEKLKDPYPDVRIKAIKALGSIDDSSVIDLIVSKLEDSNKNVRKEAVDTLAKIGWEPSEDEKGAFYCINKKDWNKCTEIGKPAINLLIEKLNDSDSNTRNSAVNALAKIGKDVFNPIIKCLNSSDDVIRRKACDVLGLMGDSRAVEPLTEMLKDSNKYVRRRATNALMLLADRDSTKSLIDALNDSETKVRLRAVMALGNIADPIAFKPLLKCLNDNNREIREAAHNSLQSIENSTDKTELKISNENIRQMERLNEIESIVYLSKNTNIDQDIVKTAKAVHGEIIKRKIQEHEVKEKVKNTKKLSIYKNNRTEEIREICTKAINNFITITDALLDVVSGTLISGNLCDIPRYSLFRDHQRVVNQSEKKLSFLKDEINKEQQETREPELYFMVISHLALGYFELKMAFDYLDIIYNKSHDNKAELFEIFSRDLNYSIKQVKNGIDIFKRLDTATGRL